MTRERKREREREKGGKAQIAWGREGGLPKFPLQFSLGKEERGKEREEGFWGGAALALCLLT